MPTMAYLQLYIILLLDLVAQSFQQDPIVDL